MRGVIDPQDRLRIPNGAKSKRDVQLIQRRICESFQIRVIDLIKEPGHGGVRKKEFTIPRHLAIYLCHQLTELPRAKIARAFNRHEDTINYALRTINNALESYPKERANIEKLQAELKKELEKAQ